MSFDFIKDKHMKIHFIGIGGISMSGLAAVLLNNGYKVSGSDSKESAILDKLRKKGAQIYIGHDSKNLVDVDLVVYTAAIPDSNPEIIEAKKQNLILMDPDTGSPEHPGSPGTHRPPSGRGASTS